MSRGIVLFGINNARINYVKLAIIAAGFIRNNMPGIPICLITDKKSQDESESLVKYFDKIIILPEEDQLFENNRTYRDTQYYHMTDSFKNETRSKVYDLSPYEETLLLDTDYLMCSDILNSVWGSTYDVMINKTAINLLHDPLEGDEDRLNKFGIKMYWATAIYFKKCEKAEELFNLVEHIKQNWQFYKLVYDFPGSLFRNDFAFSIAIHMLNGFEETSEIFPSLPDSSIFTSLDTDQFYKLKSPSELLMFVNDKKDTWKYYISNIKGINVHCMNKISLLNNYDDIIKVLYV